MECCVYCKSSRIVKNGKTKSGEQEYYCRECRSYFTPSSNPDYHLSRFDAETMRLTAFSNRQQRFEVWDKIEFLVNKKAS